MAEAFDTHAAYLELTEDGRFTTEQAEVMVSLVSSAVTGNVATKADIELVRKDMEALEVRLGSRIDALETKFDAKFEAMESKFEAMESKIEAMESKIEAMESKIEAISAKMWPVASAVVVGVVGLMTFVNFLLSLL